MNGKGLAVLNSSRESPSHCLIGLAYDLICISKNTDGGLGSSLTDLDPVRYYHSLCCKMHHLHWERHLQLGIHVLQVHQVKTSGGNFYLHHLLAL